MSSTDIHCGERKEEDHDSGMIFGDDTSETADDRRNYWKEDYHSTISKVCLDIFTEALVGILKKCLSVLLFLLFEGGDWESVNL